MIQIEAVRIIELRGIRDLEIKPKRKSFVISGGNGSGKSGVVDAIEFALTGGISRLAGKGTVGLTVLRHGPHVDRRDDPSVAEVALTLYVPEINRTAVLTRNIKTAKTFTLNPDEPKIRAAVEETARHPELILSRREIIKYIIVEAGERSKEIQALLKLDEIGATRSVLATARNKLSNSQTTAERDLRDANDSFRRHLDLKTLSPEEILVPVNKHRKILGLPELAELKPDTNVNVGVAEGGAQQAFNKESALRDVAALAEAHANFPVLGNEEVSSLLEDLNALQNEPALLTAISRRSFVERGLALVDDGHCPLCDADWGDREHLNKHLQEKLTKSATAEKLQRRLLENGNKVANHARGIAALIRPVLSVAKLHGTPELATALTNWSDSLTAFSKSLGTVENLVAKKNELEQGWIGAPDSAKTNLDAFGKIIEAMPDQSASLVAQTFLTLAEDRLTTCRSARRAKIKATAAAEAGKEVYKTYCDVAEQHLNTLYEAVEGDFSTYYREINSDDEATFKAKFEPSEGKLDLEVDFHGRGMFPPGAYHSEGHQDGMGACLYFALMKKLLGDRFGFAVLDDVVMSVDQDHRKQFCRLLKSRFPKTQFIITTHDKVWAKQMQAEKLVEAKDGVVFYNWSVQTGPIFEQASDVWDKIEADLQKNDVGGAAGRLRRHSEYVAAELADQLGATPTYRGDFSYDLGDLLPAVIGRQGELLKLAAKAASEWKDADAKARVEAMKQARTDALAAYGGESWVVNKAVHWNEWHDFSSAEFRSVVAAFKAVFQQFRCSKAECDSALYVTPKKADPETLRCNCNGISLNLKPK